MFEIQKFESVDSTMNIARENLRHGVVIQAEEQTGGRGRRGNKWISPKGNLYQSIILKPSLPKHVWGQLTFVVSVALGKTILSFRESDSDPRNLRSLTCVRDDNNFKLNLKWPNDVLINGQKIAGILIEVQDDFVIIGIGVNVDHAPDDRAKIHDFWDISVNDFRDAFLSEIEKYFMMWEAEGFAPIRESWMQHAYKLGENIQARLPNAIYDGVFEGLDDQGILLLRQNDGSLKQINSGEILV